MKKEEFNPLGFFKESNFKSSETTALFFKSTALIEYMRNEMRKAMTERDKNDEEQSYLKKFENEIEPKIVELENAIRNAAWDDITMNLGDDVNLQYENIIL